MESKTNAANYHKTTTCAMKRASCVLVYYIYLYIIHMRILYIYIYIYKYIYKCIYVSDIGGHCGQKHTFRGAFVYSWTCHPR